MSRNNGNADKGALLGDIRRAKAELDAANENFLYETDPMLVDMYTYQIKACQAKFCYLMQMARDMDLRGDNVFGIAMSVR